MSSKPKVEVAREHLSKAQEEAGAGDLRDAVQWSFASLEAAIDALAEEHGIAMTKSTGDAVRLRLSCTRRESCRRIFLICTGCSTRSARSVL